MPDEPTSTRTRAPARGRCPCGLPATYEACCARWHRGDQAPPTAELLMRSRFTAYATGDVAYLLASWHPSTRPGHLEIDPAVHWTRLEIVGTTAGGLLDREGTVAFRAHHERDGRAGVLAETSRFTRDAGRWVYLDAIEASLD